MTFFSAFPIRTYDEVSEILHSSGHESILQHLNRLNETYKLREHISRISPLPTYQFAVACALAALGNTKEAESICSEPLRFIEPEWGDNTSRELAHAFQAKPNH